MLFTDYLKKLCIITGVAIIVPLIIFLPMYFLTDWVLSNIFALIATLYLGGSGLYAITRGGTFDVFRYQFINWMSSFKKNSPRPYKDAYSYQEKLNEVREGRKNFWLPFVIIGTIFAILSIIFAFIH
jgi:hypothetical protein